MSERHFFIIIVSCIIGTVIMFSVEHFTDAMKMSDPAIAAREQYKSCVSDALFRGGKPEICAKILENVTATPIKDNSTVPNSVEQ